MSVDFYIAVHMEGGTRYVYRCDCSQRWCDACDIAFDKGERSPLMFSCENCTDVSVNLHNQNAGDWMRWVGLDASKPYGEIKASELAALCRRRLWDEKRNHDDGITFEEYHGAMGARVITGGRPDGRLRQITEQMLRVCEKAGERLIAWG
jgi:hypothetical protein